MTSPENLDKLFEAALNEKTAPSRFGTPEEMKKKAPSAFSKNAEAVASKPVQSGSPVVVGAAQAETVEVNVPEPEIAPDLIDISKTGDPLAGNAVKSKDETISAELGAILDEKVAREKRSKKRSRLIALGLLIGVTGGTSAWVVTNSERFEALKSVVAEIKSAGDIKGMVAKYQAALDRVSVRGEQIDAATQAMGVDPTSMDHVEDQGFDKEMSEMMGEEGGSTTAARDKLLREKFKSVEESGSLVPQKEE
jgi:hypothetical protein